MEALEEATREPNAEPSRRCTLASLVAAALLLSSCSDPTPPNLLLISLDTTRADHLSVYDPSKNTTPHLRELAAEGAKFTAAYAATATTGPSHATLFTSLHPYTHGLLKNGIVLDGAFVTLAELLAERGYATHGVTGSYPLNAGLAFDQGFVTWDDDFDPSMSSYEHDEWGGEKLAGGFDRPADDTTRRATARLEALASAETPFFLFVHYFDPHDPYAPPQRFRDPDARARGGRAALHALYDGEIRFVDEQLGVLLDRLAALGLDERTLVVVVGDHGEGLLDRGHLAHGRHIYDEGVRVPLLMRMPGVIPPGSAHPSPVGAVDLTPTILDLLTGAPVAHPQFQGASLADAIRAGRDAGTERPVFLTRRRYADRRTSQSTGGGELPPPRGEQHAVRIDRWKYLEAPSEGAPELYDLESDPGERRNVARQQPERSAELRAILRGWRAGQRTTTRVPEVPEEVRRRLEAMGYVE